MFFERRSPGVSVSQEMPETLRPRRLLTTILDPRLRYPTISCPSSPATVPRSRSLVNIHRYYVHDTQEHRNLSFPASIRGHLVLLRFDDISGEIEDYMHCNTGC